jgi:hypothetical protein
MDLKKFNQLKSKFVAREVGEELIVVPLTGSIAQMSEMFTLNATAKFIWESIDENSTTESLETLLTDTFEVDAETASRDISNFLVQMAKMIDK